QKILPGVQQIVGRDAESTFNKEIQSGLPCRAQIQQSAAAKAVQIPEKFLQSIGDPRSLVALRSPIRADSHGRRAVTGMLSRVTSCRRARRNVSGRCTARSNSQFVQK